MPSTPNGHLRHQHHSSVSSVPATQDTPSSIPPSPSPDQDSDCCDSHTELNGHVREPYLTQTSPSPRPRRLSRAWSMLSMTGGAAAAGGGQPVHDAGMSGYNTPGGAWASRFIGGAGGHHPTPSAATSRPQSPTFYRSAIADIHGVLYNGVGLATHDAFRWKRDKEEVQDVIESYYDVGATFENPVIHARGSGKISDQFCLSCLFPGTFWSELGDVCESESYDGSRLVIMTHTLHVSLYPSSSLAPGENKPPDHPYMSYPSTPYASSTSVPPFFTSQDSGSHSPPHASTSSFSIPNYDHLHSTAVDHPLSILMRSLAPSNILSTILSLDLKITTRLSFNEAGKVVRHEDTYGMKEIMESWGGVAVRGLYTVNRRLIGRAASLACSIFLRAPNPDSAVRLEDGEEQRTPRRRGLSKSGTTPVQGRSRKSSVAGPSLGSALGLKGMDPIVQDSPQRPMPASRPVVDLNHDSDEGGSSV